MKTGTKIFIAIGVAIGLGSITLIHPTFAHGEKRFHGPMQGAHGQFGEHRRAMRMFDEFDANKDGNVTQDEVDRTRSERHTRFDKDSDGKLNLKEYEALWIDAMRERMVNRFQRLDRDGDATVTMEEFAAPTRRIVFWMDSDEDGTVRLDELRKDRRRHHKERHDRDNDRR